MSSDEDSGFLSGRRAATEAKALLTKSIAKRYFTRVYVGLAMWLSLLLMVAVYEYQIVPRYDYYNFTWFGVTGADIALALLSLAPMIVLLPLRVRSIGDVAEWVVALCVFLPAMIIPTVSGYIRGQDVASFNFLLSLGYVMLHVARVLLGSGQSIRFFSLDRGKMEALLIVVWLTIYGVFFAFAGLGIFGNALSNVYDARAEFRANVVSRSVFLAYSVPLAVKVVNPMLLVLGLAWRRYHLFAMGVFGSFAVFSANGQKSVLLTLLAAPVLFLILRHRKAVSGFALVTGFMLLGAVSMFQEQIMELFYRRVVVVPGLLVGMYFDHYHDGDFALLGHSIFGPFLPGDVASPAREVGMAYWNSASMAANVNFLGDGFANFGAVGVVVFSTLLGAFLGFADRLSRGVPFGIAVGSFTGVCFALVDTALLTTMVTHGAVVLVLLLSAYPGREEGRGSIAAARSPRN